MKNTQYRRSTPVKPTMRPSAQDIAHTGVELVELTKATLQNPAADITALAMAYRIFELDALAAGFDEKLMADATELGLKLADAYHKVQEGKRAKAEDNKTGIVGLDGKKLSKGQETSLITETVGAIAINETIET